MTKAKGLVARSDPFRKRRPQFCGNDESETDRDQKERKELAARKTGDQRGVRFAKIFNPNPKNRVANEKQAGENSVRLPHSRADQPEDREQNDSFKESFVKLRRMPRRQNPAKNFFHLRLMTNRSNNCVRRIERWIDLSAGNDRAFRLANVFGELFRKLHRPRDVRRATIKLAVDEIGAAPEKQTEGRGYNQIVGQIHP